MASCVPDITHPADPPDSSKRILYPFFADAAAYTHDPLWIELLIHASMGVFPKNFSFTNGFLIYNDTVNCFSVPIGTTDPNEIVRIFRSCLQVYGCIYSELDQWNMISDHMTTPTAGLSWTSIKKKSQGIIVDKFIDREVIAKELTDEQRVQLRSILSMGISLGFFNKENIVIDNYDIKTINGLLFDETTGRYSIDQSIKPKTKRVTVSRKTSSTRPQTYGEKWISYHDSLSSISTSPIGSDTPEPINTGASIIVVEEYN